jgi:hypothetical protein
MATIEEFVRRRRLPDRSILTDPAMNLRWSVREDAGTADWLHNAVE